jgi:hypothetical protein
MSMTGAPAKGEPRKRHGRIAFIALRETIRTEIEQGWPLTAIYEKHSGQLGIGYSQFTRYVGVDIRGKASKSRNGAIAAASPPSGSSAAGTPAASGKEPFAAAASESRRFHFDPTAVDRKKLV